MSYLSTVTGSGAFPHLYQTVAGSGAFPHLFAVSVLSMSLYVALSTHFFRILTLARLEGVSDRGLSYSHVSSGFYMSTRLRRMTLLLLLLLSYDLLGRLRTSKDIPGPHRN